MPRLGVCERAVRRRQKAAEALLRGARRCDIQRAPRHEAARRAAPHARVERLSVAVPKTRGVAAGVAAGHGLWQRVRCRRTAAARTKRRRAPRSRARRRGRHSSRGRRSKAMRQGASANVCTVPVQPSGWSSRQRASYLYSPVRHSFSLIDRGSARFVARATPSHAHARPHDTCTPQGTRSTPPLCPNLSPPPPTPCSRRESPGPIHHPARSCSAIVEHGTRAGSFVDGVAA